MNQDQIDRILLDGIAAAKNGENSKARRLLLSVIEANEENERAWLWLSGAVDTYEDRQICLENVLVINPNNAVAKRGLERLRSSKYQADERVEPKSPSNENDREFEGSTPLIKDHSIVLKHQETQLSYFPTISFQSESIFNDVWERDSDICECCATKIKNDDRRCPNCGKKIFSFQFRYRQPSSDLTIYWILLLSIAQLSLVLILVNLLIRESLLATVWKGMMFIVLVVLVAGVFFRQFWAYMASLVFLVFAIATIILSSVFGPAIDDVVVQAVESGFIQSLSNRPYIFILGPLEDLLIPLQSLAIILALFYGVFRVGPDFERLKVRHVAQVDRKLGDAFQLYEAGNECARQKKWASAILHYQKAVAHSPTQFYYLRALGQAYAQLEYYQRSLDVLESAYRMTVNPDLKLELERIIAQVEYNQALSSRVS